MPRITKEGKIVKTKFDNNALKAAAQARAREKSGYNEKARSVIKTTKKRGK